ncbi:transcriptional regulator, TetR family [Sphingomonas laterariae]|uniref:Transcriptional regulator, TetR family n=1 Tax=Edaphosphingomonas laterariae TaxID=861865 RepID=A0A239BXG8_9SPHN|nr:TetR/AcrR family transcriptional regulator [Sphingomonas laterariae]SNS12707.1 transcriptional regulator, TetR family [Sphingomonas laterariae]
MQENGTEPATRGRPLSSELDEAILEAACTVLARQGYRGFSFDAVARTAGTTRPAIYRRWTNRDELLLATLDHAMRIEGAPADIHLTFAALPDADLLAAFEEMALTFARIVSEPRASAVSISVSAAMYEDDALRALAQSHHYDRRRPLEDMMHLLCDRGLLRRDIPVADLIHALVGAVHYRSSMMLEAINDAYVVNVVRLMTRPARD